MKRELENNLKETLRNALLADGFNEFTKSDWDGLAGAEMFEDGSQPLVKYDDENEVIYIYDQHGLSVMEGMGIESAILNIS